MSPQSLRALPQPDPEQLADYSQFPDRVGATLDDKVILVTGATGYVGKALIEKILHFSNVKKMYLLIKDKRGKSVEERMAHFFDGHFFDSMKRDRGDDVIKKVEVVTGNVAELDLGISRADRRKLIDEVNIIYHSAASVRFDECLQKIILLNVRGTRCMLSLAKECKNFELFVHISTTFCVPSGKELPEGPIEIPYNPHEMIRIAENLDLGTLNILCNKLIKDFSNTYGFTKALSEGLVYEQMGKLPVLIVRPSIVMPVWKLPIPGYVDSLNGPITLWILCAKGMLRVTRNALKVPMNFVPLDSVINGIMIATYNYLNETEMKSTVFNASNMQIPMNQWATNLLPIFLSSPIKPGLGHPCFVDVNCPFLYNMIVYFFQLLPCLILDNIVEMKGSKPKYVNIQRSLYRAIITLSCYTSQEWQIRNEKFRNLRMNLNEREDATYPLNIEEVDLSKYSAAIIASARVFIFHEKFEDIDKNRRILKIHYIIYTIVKWLLYGYLIMITYYKVIPSLIRFVYYIFDV